jgi:hypothetical protein
MTAAIAIAAGGGGDAVTAAVLCGAMPELGVRAIMSYSWDRLMIDPTPGPRTIADFDGLIDHHGVWEVPPTAVLRTGGRSTLPRLASHIAQPMLLMDIAGGAAGLAEQIGHAADVFEANHLIVIDVGGDILAEGHEPGLRSPLADSLGLAAAMISGLPTQVLVAGIGLDGELTCTQINRRLDELGAHSGGALTAEDVQGFEDIWTWHPSEANAMLAAAAGGWRGSVETQRDAVVDLTDDSTRICRIDAEALAESSLAALLTPTSTLDEVEQLLRERRGYSDIDIERTRSTRLRPAQQPAGDALAIIDRHISHAADCGVDAVTVRRIAELTCATNPAATQALRDLLASRRPHNFRPPLYLVRPAGIFM